MKKWNAVFLLAASLASAASLPACAFEFSRAGYWEAKDSPRLVRSMNQGWEFSLDAFRTTKAVNLPHSIDEGEIGLNASGCVNRQQPAWYRKTFGWKKTHAHAFLHFEAIMGKSRITVNGRCVADHFGGFLPVHVEVTDDLKDGENTVEVWCDNSDDTSYPPGKAQDMLDWTYFGGIYRDCWLVETGEAYVSDSDMGGVYVTTKLECDGTWTVDAAATLGGEKGATCEFVYDGKGVTVPFKPESPALWTPDSPNLHTLEARVRVGGRETDAIAVRFGIRDVRIDGGGLSLNGRPWRKMVGVNRHQDFAYIGMALANSLHWRDAKKYRDAGFTVIRNAHYPQDPAFMDACDALGLFVVVNPPGWQFWNDRNPLFASRVYDDIRKMVRRDRSRASLLFWEPILNETRYPADFAKNAYGIVKQETHGRDYCACDIRARGSDAYDIVYDEPDSKDPRPHFRREWGDFPDDWNAQNSPSRTPIEWGEGPMLVQAEHYARADYSLSVEKIMGSPASFLGGCIWHGADHARGYHPDNFFGGVLSYDRRKKYSYFACKAMLTREPFVYLANQLAVYSPQTIAIYSNCAYKATWLGGDVKNGDRIDRGLLRNVNYRAVHTPAGQEDPHATDFVISLPDGSAVTNRHAGRFERIVLELDTEGLPPLGDGSDLVACAAVMCDKVGRPRRYQTEEVEFSAEGAVQIVGENPQRTRWGEAVVLLKPLSPGKITVTASLTRNGAHLPPPASLEFIASESGVQSVSGSVAPNPGKSLSRRVDFGAHRAVDLSEVERQQHDFGADGSMAKARAGASFRLYNIVPMLPGREAEQAARCVDMYGRTGEDIAIYSLTLHPEGVPAKAKADRYIASYRAFSKALEGTPVRPGVLVQAILGHWQRIDKEIEPWTRTIDHQGKEARFCPLDPAFADYITYVFTEIAKCHPSFVMLDDDVRVFVYGGTGGECFCDRHVERFNAMRGTRHDSASLRAAIRAAKPGDMDFAAFHAMQREFLEDLVVGRARAALDAVDPSIPGGVCLANSWCCFGEPVARRMAAKGQRPVMRVPTGCYYERLSADKFPQSFLKMQCFVSYYHDSGIDILDEADTCPHNLWSKSARAFYTHLMSAAFLGMSGAKTWYVNCAKRSGEDVPKAYTDAISRCRGQLAALSRSVAGTFDVGVAVPSFTNSPSFHPTENCYGSFMEKSEAEKDIVPFGIPVAASHDFGNRRFVFTLSTKEEVERLTDDELRHLFSGRVLVFREAATALDARGLARWTGTTAKPESMKFTVEHDLMNDVSLPHSSSYAGSVKFEPLEGVEILSEFCYEDPATGEMSVVAPSAVRFRNELGGDVVTCAYHAGMLFLQTYSESRKRWMLSLVDRLAGPDRFTACEAQQDVLVAERLAADGTRLVLAVNLNPEPICDLKMRVPPGSKVDVLSPKGEWIPAGRVPLDFYEAAVLRIMSGVQP